MPARRRASPRAAKPYDAAMKELIGLDPATWLSQFGVQPAGPVSVLSADLAGTVLVEADQVLRVGGGAPWLVQLEFQAGRDRHLTSRLHLYSTLLDRRHRLPVQSLLVLLRPAADSPTLDGHFERRLPNGRAYLTFEYGVVRIWQQPAEALLAGPLATLPLAPLAGVPDAEVSEILRRIEARVRREAASELAERLRVGAYLLLGLRFPQDVIDELLRGVGIMAGALKESSTYQKILREGLAEGRALGRAEAARELLLHLGTRRFGQPNRATRAALERIDDSDQLRHLAERLDEVSNWRELGIDGR